MAPQALEEFRMTLTELEKQFKAREPVLSPHEVVSRHIKRLHEYNESKDAAQILIAKLAGLERVPIREIHERFGLKLCD